VISPVIARLAFTLRCVKAEANEVAIVIPADGPSFGIAPSGTWTWMFQLSKISSSRFKSEACALIYSSASIADSLTQRKVKANLAMTGEITLRGKVLPVGGIKEKILAAKRAGIKEIIMSAENKKNIDEIQDIYLKGLTFHYVNDVKEVFAIALTQEKVADAIDLSVKKANQE